MSDANEKELSVFGFAKGMRAGLVTFILSLLIGSNIYLFIALENAKEKTLQIQANGYEKMIEYMKPTKDLMTDVAKKVDTAATKAIASSDRVDSVSTMLLIKKQLK